MSYEPDPHTVQVKILKGLLFAKRQSFAKLQQATNLTSDHFTFHIKKLIQEGYINKNENQYSLSAKGKEYANRLDTESNEIERQPKVSVALIIERHTNKGREFLFQQRLKNPYYGFWGRLGGKVRWGESIQQAASRELLEETGLRAEFTYKMLYHKRDYDKSTKALLEDKIFLILHTSSAMGVLQEHYEGGLNKWMTQDEFLNTEKRFESAYEFVDLMDENITYYEKDFYYDEAEY